MGANGATTTPYTLNGILQFLSVSTSVTLGGSLTVSSTTASTTTSTGALIVSGGAGIAGAVSSGYISVIGTNGAYNVANKFGVDHFGGQARVYSNGPDASTNGGFDFNSVRSDGTNQITALSIAPTAVSTFYGTTSPGTAGSNEVLIGGGQIKTAGAIYAYNIMYAGSAGTGTGGNYRYIDDGGTVRWLTGILGSVGARNWSLFDVVNNAERMNIDATTGAATFGSTTASTSTTTGALVVGGGIGVGGAINAGGPVTASGFAATANTNGVFNFLSPRNTNAGSSAYTLSYWGNDTSAVEGYIILNSSTNTALAGAGSFNVGGAKSFGLVAGGTVKATVTESASAEEMHLYLYDASAATLKRVSRGAADSGGTGYRLLRIEN